MRQWELLIKYWRPIMTVPQFLTVRELGPSAEVAERRFFNSDFSYSLGNIELLRVKRV